MRRSYKSGAVRAPPTAPAVPSLGYPTEGDQAADIDPTVPGAFFFHSVAEEIVGVIEGAGITADDSVTQLREAIRTMVAAAGPQTGDIKFTAGTAAPTGWLECDGSILAADSPHASLRTFLGTRFAASSDPPGTVRLPDARRAALIGSGGGASTVIGNTVGSRGGAETHRLSIAEMPAHTHDYRYGDRGGSDRFSLEPDPRARPLSTSATGGDQPHNNMPPSLVVLVVIKT